jgi:hypothetical protein
MGRTANMRMVAQWFFKAMPLIWGGVLGFGCAPTQQIRLLVPQDDAQMHFFSGEALTRLARESKFTLTLERYDSTTTLDELLGSGAAQPALVLLPLGAERALIDQGRLRALDSLVDKDAMHRLHDEYLLTSLAMRDSSAFCIPHQFQTNVMVCSRSKVEDALSSWRSFKPAIDGYMRSVNGFGLPATYLLESDVNQWDFYDVFVVGWIWAHTPYEGVTRGRVGHSADRGSKTVQRLIERAMQCGGDSVTLQDMRSQPLRDCFEWEALYASAEIYPAAMVEQRWSAEAVVQRFAAGELFLSFMNQNEIFELQSAVRDTTEGYRGDGADLLVALMPAGCSVELDKIGNPLRTGQRSVTTAGWWWGIPHGGAAPQLGLEIALAITNTTTQIQASTRFGMIPVRKDILSDMAMMFGGGWKTALYESSFRQLMHNRDRVMPRTVQWEKVAQVYLDGWADIVVGKNWAEEGSFMQRDYIGSLLELKYAPRVVSALVR